MSDSSGDAAGSAFGAFPPGDMMAKMWEMMKLNPFAAAASGGGATPSLGMMSDLLTPLTNVEELDKRITDMRAVEQWLKLNLNMLQSAIQALEVQRATLATLRAFGAYAKDAAAQQGDGAPFASLWPMGSTAPKAEESTPPADTAQHSKPESGSANDAAFDPSGWWNLLQSQFNNLASLAMVQADAAAKAAEAPAAKKEPDAEAPPPVAKKASSKKPASKKTSAPKEAE
jgi:hypothetical protein